MFRNTNKVSVLSGLLLGLCLPLVATTALAEEYFTIKDGELERPTGYREWIRLLSFRPGRALGSVPL